MDLYEKYKSPLGYEIGDDGVDSYGVNHRGFSRRDELEYQVARQQREQQLMQNYNNQGITQDYPQYGTNFWGDNTDNNYGFGSSDISGNIQNVTNQLNNQGMSYNNQYSGQRPTPWSVSAIPKYTTSTPWRNNQTITPWNGGYDLSSYGKTSYTSRRMNNRTNQTPDFSELSNSPLNMGLTARYGQAHLRGLDTNLIQNREIVNSPYSNDILENDCYQSERFKPFAERVRWNEGENRGITYATPEKYGTDQPTKYGISQSALDSYRKQYYDLAKTYPANVKYLTEDQAMNLLCQYYKDSRVEAINDPNLAFSVYDSYVNNPNNASIAWQQTLKNNVDPNIRVGGGIGSQTINGFNSVQGNTELLNTFINNRQKTLEDRYKKGLKNRFRHYPIK